MKKKFLLAVLPSIISMVLFNLYTIVDGIFVANFVGEEALAAINIALPYTNAIFSISVLLSVGSSALISLAKGQNDQSKVNKLFSMNLIVLSIVSLLIAVISHLNVESLASFLGATTEIKLDVIDYLKIITIFAPIYMVSYLLEVYIKADGYAYKAMIGIIIGALTNIILDYVFMKVFSLGIKGAAIATGIGQLTTFIYFCFHYFIFNKSGFHFTKGKYPFNEYQRIIPLGVADFMSEISGGLMALVYNLVVAKILQTSGLVTMGILMYIYNLVIMANVGACQGMLPLLSYSFGKKDQYSHRKYLKYGVLTIFSISIVVMLIVNLLSNNIVGLYLHQDSHLYSETIQALHIISLAFMIIGYNIFICTYFTSLMCAKVSLLLSLLRCVIIMIASILIMGYLFQALGIWLAPLISEFICLIISLYQIRKQKDRIAW